jgi:ribokinase
MTARIAVVGSINVDMVMRCERLPRPGETIHGLGMEVQTGGKGANQAVAAARLGASVHFVGCVGSDTFGDQALQTLRDERLDTSRVSRIPGPTGVAMILVEAASGQNCIVLEQGANARLSEQLVDDAASVIAEASMLVCQLETPLPAVQRAMQIARRAKVPVLLNPAPARVLPPELLAAVDVLIPNESEAALLAGVPAEGADALQCAQYLRAQGARSVIVTLGARGACVLEDAQPQWLPAQPVQAIDTTGAGDAFVGAFAVARCEGASLPEAVAFAQRMASISVTRQGAMPSMAHRNEVLERGWWPFNS